jgi:manganese transport protein
MQLSFAIFPLMKFTSDRKLMGEFTNPLWVKIVGYTICSVIASLNVALLFQVLGLKWMALLVGVAAAFTVWVRWFYKGD